LNGSGGAFFAHGGSDNPAQVAGQLASNVVFHSPVFVTAIVGRQPVAAVLAAWPSGGRAAYTAEHRLDDRTTFLRWADTIEGHEIEGLEVIVCNDRGLISDWTLALRPFPAVSLFREALYPLLKDVLAPNVWEYPDVARSRRPQWVMQAGNRFGFLSCRARSSDLRPLSVAGISW
jgi:hypothetical protein